jgi:hypothetical protein
MAESLNMSGRWLVQAVRKVSAVRTQFAPVRSKRCRAFKLAPVTAVVIVTLGSGLLSACSELMQSPRQKVVRDAHAAVCEKRDIMAMGPFLTEKSQPALKLMGSMAELGKLFGANASDRLAIECQTGAGFEFLEEVKVTETRYVVRTRSRGSAEVTEYIVVQEAGQWKIMLGGK